MHTVLIVEDDRALADELAIALRYHGLNPVVASTWDGALALIATAAPDLIVLDQRLGAVDALTQLPSLRLLTTAPVIVLTSNRVEMDRVLALERGADDFLIKPISGREFVARVRAHLRRAAISPSPASVRQTKWRFLRNERRLLRPDGTPVALTGAEFDLLTHLIEAPSKPLSRDELTRRVFNRPWHPEERAIDNLVLHLRQKIGPGGEHTIVAIRNQGYAFTAFPEP